MGILVYLIVLRLLHIVAGVFWAGTTFFMIGFMNPALRMAGPGGQDYMRALTQRTRLSLMMTGTGVATTLAGILLYLHDSGYFRSNWLVSGMGLTLAVGGVLGIAAFVIGASVNSPAAKQMGRLGREIAAAGGPPSPEQMAQMQALQKRLSDGTYWIGGLLLITVITMAIARYIRF